MQTPAQNPMVAFIVSIPVYELVHNNDDSDSDLFGVLSRNSDHLLSTKAVKRSETGFGQGFRNVDDNLSRAQLATAEITDDVGQKHLFDAVHGQVSCIWTDAVEF